MYAKSSALTPGKVLVPPVGYAVKPVVAAKLNEIPNPGCADNLTTDKMVRKKNNTIYLVKIFI